MGQVLQAAPGRLAWHEKDVRLLLQLLFLRPTAASSREEHGYWLDQLLKPWPITFQAKLLYLLTGPVDSQGQYSLWLLAGSAWLLYVTRVCDYVFVCTCVHVGFVRTRISSLEGAMGLKCIPFCSPSDVMLPVFFAIVNIFSF